MQAFDYTGAYVYSLTIVTRRRQPFFRDGKTVDLARASLERAAEKHEFVLEAYCFMPDHLHLLVSGSEEARLKSFVHLFKQLSGYAAKKKLGEPIWQISYYDHVVRREEDLEVANYIWSNPVQAGLVDDLRDYPYSGPRPVLEALGRPEGLQLQVAARD